MRKIYLLLLLFLLGTQVRSQTILTTGNPNSVTTFFGSANFVLTFVIVNTNNYPIDITNMDVFRGSTSNGTTFSLYYHTTSLSGTTSFTAPGWNFVTSAAVSTVTTNGIYPTFSNFTVTIPANTTYRFMQVCSGSSIVCGATGATPNSFSSGGVIIGAGNYQINGVNVGYAASGSSTPYFWAGTITFAPSVPCSNPPTAGTATVTNAMPCAGSSIDLNLSGGSGGLGQTYQWQSAPSLSGPWTNVGTQSGAYYPISAPATTTYYRAYVVCGSGSDTSTPVTVTIPTAFPAGTYTIDNTQPTGNGNFNSFDDAAAAINCGIAGPVVFNVAPGTYNNDKFWLDSYVNAPGNSITINGNGAVLSRLSTSGAEPAIIRLKGTKNVTISNLKIEGISTSTSQWAWGVFMTNGADSNTITGCTITLDTTATSTNYAGIVMSGASSSATQAGSGCDGIVISNNVIQGGYYGITAMGNSGVNILQGNQITGNVLKNFYVYGIYASYSNNMLIADNDISRPSRTSVTTFGGLYLPTGHTNLNVTRNKIHDPAAGSPNASFTLYGIYLTGAANASNPNTISNNLIYNLQGGGTGVIYPLYNSGATYTRYYHNTVSNDYTASTGSGASYGFYQTGTATGIELYNNLFSVTRGGAGTKWGIYVATSGQTVTSDYNNVYVSSPDGFNNFGYIGAVSHASKASWTTASSQDANSHNYDPVFQNPAAGNLAPTNGGMDDKGMITSITVDINNNTRNAATPDIGAYEFSVPPCAGSPVAGTVSGPVSACPNANFTLNVTGYSLGTGITIQWQESPTGAGLFTNIPGATSSSLTTSLTSSTDYRALIICSNGGGNDVTPAWSVGVDPFFVCYCSPYTGVQLHTSPQNYITGVNISNTGLGVTTTAIGGGGYTRHNYNIPTNTTILSQTTSYTLNVTVPSASYNVMAWIDYDQSGTFDSVEATQLSTTATLATGSFTVPLSALTGQTGMRVRVYTSTPYGENGACTTISTGYETEDFVVSIAPPPSCQQPSGFSLVNLTASGANISWGTVTGAAGYEWAVSTSATPPSSGTPVSGATAAVSGLAPSTPHYLFVRTDCGTNGYSLWSVYSFTTAAINNDPWDAIPVAVGATCSGTPFTTVGGTHAANEPWPTCAGTGGFHSVWYSFVAPASGAVKISTDFAGGTMSTDTRLALFSTTNVNNYNDYTILACDDDNGSVVSIRSIIYATGLTFGTTYYVLVDVYDAVAQASSSYPGTFCLEVHELNNNMLAASGSCAAGQSFSRNAGFKGYSALTDASGNLIALVKDTAGTAATYAASLTKNTSAVRSAGGRYYLDRNYLISGATTGNIEVQLFFTAAELAALQAADPTAILSNLHVTRQTGSTCQINFTSSAGTNTALLQQANGTAGNAHWVTVTTPGFSNFFIQSGTTPLAIRLAKITAENFGKRNRIDWMTEQEMKGDFFDLERSADGQEFARLASFAAQGSPSTYTYWDEKPLDGKNHYRLKMSDARGEISYSSVVTAIAKDGAFTVLVYPNPASETATIQLIGEPGTDVSVTLSDLSGRVVRQIPVAGKTMICDLSGLAQGVYLLQYSDNQHSETIKLTKQ